MATDLKLGVFIDCENASAKLLLKFISEKHHLANAGTRRAFGNAQTLRAWRKFFERYDFEQVETPPSARKKNATDFNLVINCVHTHQINHFKQIWLVTSDSDFALLAKHLKSNGAKVYCAGEAKTPPAFRSECKEFYDYKAETKPPATTTDSKPSPHKAPQVGASA